MIYSFIFIRYLLQFDQVCRRLQITRVPIRNSIILNGDENYIFCKAHASHFHEANHHTSYVFCCAVQNESWSVTDVFWCFKKKKTKLCLCPLLSITDEIYNIRAATRYISIHTAHAIYNKYCRRRRRCRDFQAHNIIIIYNVYYVIGPRSHVQSHTRTVRGAREFMRSTIGCRGSHTDR